MGKRCTVEIDQNVRELVSKQKGKISFIDLTSALYMEYLDSPTLQKRVITRMITDSCSK